MMSLICCNQSGEKYLAKHTPQSYGYLHNVR